MSVRVSSDYLLITKSRFSWPQYFYTGASDCKGHLLRELFMRGHQAKALSRRPRLSITAAGGAPVRAALDDVASLRAAAARAWRRLPCRRRHQHTGSARPSSKPPTNPRTGQYAGRSPSGGGESLCPPLPQPRPTPNWSRRADPTVPPHSASGLDQLRSDQIQKQKASSSRAPAVDRVQPLAHPGARRPGTTGRVSS